MQSRKVALVQLQDLTDRPFFPEHLSCSACLGHPKMSTAQNSISLRFKIQGENHLSESISCRLVSYQMDGFLLPIGRLISYQRDGFLLQSGRLAEDLRLATRDDQPSSDLLRPLVEFSNVSYQRDGSCLCLKVDFQLDRFRAGSLAADLLLKGRSSPLLLLLDSR
jgi:hypothetical protein